VRPIYVIQLNSAESQTEQKENMRKNIYSSDFNHCTVCKTVTKINKKWGD